MFKPGETSVGGISAYDGEGMRARMRALKSEQDGQQVGGDSVSSGRPRSVRAICATAVGHLLLSYSCYWPLAHPHGTLCPKKHLYEEFSDNYSEKVQTGGLEKCRQGLLRGAWGLKEKHF